MRPAHRNTRLALLASAALLLSACGIPTTGVVESGAPATGIPSPTLIYFTRNDALIAVPRKTDREIDVTTALGMLLQGPNGDEQGAGVSTAIPPLKVPPTIASKDKSQVFILLPPGIRPLSNLAIRQLICTTAHARHTQDPDVRVMHVIVNYAPGDSGVWQVGTSGGGCVLTTSRDIGNGSGRPTPREGASPNAGRPQG